MNELSNKKIKVKDLPNGDSLHINVIEINGTKHGPHVHIQSSVHGAELQGNVVIYHLLEYFKENPLNGSITFIPLANPTATNQKNGTYTAGRFNPITGDNWNRNYVDLENFKTNITQFSINDFVKNNKDNPNIYDEFKKYIQSSLEALENHYKSHHYGIDENKLLNITLQKIASKSDIVLDLHTGPHATRYLYCADFEKNDGKQLHFPFTLIIPNEFAGAMDEATFMPWYLLQQEMKAQGMNKDISFNAFTIEQGSEERVNSFEAEKDADRILHYLHYKGSIDKKPDITTSQKWSELSNYRTYYSPTSGLCEFIKGPGEQFKKGDLLAKVYRPMEINSFNLDETITKIVAIEDGAVINHYPSASVGSGCELFQVLTNLKNF